MNQLDFLEPSMSTARTADATPSRSPVSRFPRARRDDSRSSHEAAALIEKTGVAAHQAAQALAAVRQWPNSTSMELARVAHMDRYALARRLPELVREGFVHKIEPTEASVPCAVSGKRVVRWQAA